MIRELTYTDKNNILQIIKSRNYMWNKDIPVNISYYEKVLTEKYFNINKIYGYFIDNKLDCFVICVLWKSPFDTYSIIMFTENKENREKDNFGTDINLLQCINYSVNCMENIERIISYHCFIDDDNWKIHANNPNHAMYSYQKNCVEKIPSNNFSTNNLFIKYVVGRTYSYPVKVMCFRKI